MRTTLDLALRYVAHRHQSGALNRRSAEQVRSRLVDFARSAPEDPAKVRRRHVEAWMERPELAPQYRRTRLSTVRGFCRWCVANGHMALDPTLTVESPKIPDALPKRMTHAEASALCKVARDDPRTLLVVLFMLQEGLRRVELERLRVEDLDFADRTVRVRGKGGHGLPTDALPVSGETWAALEKYLAETGARHGPVLRSRVHPERGLSANYISEMVRQAMYASGIKRPGDSSRSPHSARHTAAHDILERTNNVRAVQQALRHRSVRSTEVYLRGHVTELRDVMAGRSYLTT